MKRPAWPILLLLTALLAAAGCTSSPTTDAGAATPSNGSDAQLPVETGRAGLVPAARPPISDLPIPMGFALVEDVSRDATAGGRRTVDHTYQGREDKYDVDRFYGDQMPLKGWIAASRRMDSGTITHEYTKAGERCVIVITDRKTLAGRRATIHLTVGPKDH